MVDLETHQIVDILESRDSEEVAKWLKTFPQIKVISRDGAQGYASAASNAHPSAIQITDRFHLLKNLCDIVSSMLQREFPSRVAIPATSVSSEMQNLYNTANHAERIHFAKEKRADGFTVQEIAYMLHSSAKTINRYLSCDEKDIPRSTLYKRQQEHEQEIKRKKNAIEEVRRLFQSGYSITQISTMTGHIPKTVKNYLQADCPVVNAKYDTRMPGKLAPYESDVIRMRSEGITYSEIHKMIKAKGYTGSVASLRMFMQRERAHQKNGAQRTDIVTGASEYMQRKSLCRLIYSKIEDVPQITKEQYQAVIKQYPILSHLYTMVQELHRIIFSKKPEEIEGWITKAQLLNNPDLNSYLSGLENDLSAVKNAIEYPYSNGLAEGSVNKIKLTKRIMYGRNSFDLLKAKLLLSAYFN